MRLKRKKAEENKVKERNSSKEGKKKAVNKKLREYSLIDGIIHVFIHIVKKLTCNRIRGITKERIISGSQIHTDRIV